jgi:small subunit ribosomal protein S17
VERGRRKELVGTVVSNKMDKTAVVSVERRIRHPLYRKIIRRTTRYKAHDPRNEVNLGDVVRLEETRPLSKEKRWRIAAILTRGDVAEVQPSEIPVPEEVIAPKEEPAPASERSQEAAELEEKVEASAEEAGETAAEEATEE